jgi:hypothetical protein
MSQQANISLSLRGLRRWDFRLKTYKRIHTIYESNAKDVA